MEKFRKIFFPVFFLYNSSFVALRTPFILKLIGTQNRAQPLSSENPQKLLVWEKSAKFVQLLLQVNNAAAGGTVKSNCFLG